MDEGLKGCVMYHITLTHPYWLWLQVAWKEWLKGCVTYHITIHAAAPLLVVAASGMERMVEGACCVLYNPYIVENVYVCDYCSLYI